MQTRVDSRWLRATLHAPQYMKLPRILLALVVSFAAAFTAPAADSSEKVYELRTYTAPPGKIGELLARFRQHTLKIFERHGMVNVGYWVPMDEKDGSADKLIYLLEHKSRDAAKASWKAFGADPEWQDVSKKTQVNGKIVAKVESVYLKPTDFSRGMSAGKSAGGTRVFELRTYTTPEGKLPNLDARFRDHTVALFAKHGITNLGYFHPTDADKGAANTLIYFIAHKNRDAAAASFKAFREDPDWVKARTASEKAGKITSEVKSVFLTPTDFSSLK
jgi:hypothetical protein